MSAALISTTVVGVVGLGYSAVLGFTTASSADLFFHISLGIFSTLVTLLSHSMTMFYLIGKGKAVREAVIEGQLSLDLYNTVVRARRPVFSVATGAMTLTMVTAILGGGVDTGSIPAGVHLFFAVSAIAANLAGLRNEIIAMVSSTRIVAEINQLLKDRS